MNIRRALLVYSALRIGLVMVAAVIVLVSLISFYLSWHPPGLDPILVRLRALGYEPERPDELYSIIAKASPESLGQLKKVLLLAPYDAVGYGFAMFNSRLAFMVHGLVFLLTVIYASTLNDLFRSGLYSVVSSLEGNRLKMFWEVNLGATIIALAAIYIALSPILVSEIFNPWVGWRGIGPLFLVFLATLFSILIEYLLYISIANIFVYYNRFTEYLLFSLILIFLLPVLVIGIVPRGTSEAIIKILYGLLVALLPLYAAPGLLVEIVLHANADKQVITYFNPTPPEAFISSIALAVAVATITTLYYIARLKLQKEVP